MGIESVITAVILAAAAVWAARRIWQSARGRRSRSPDNPICGGGCGKCSVPTDLGVATPPAPGAPPPASRPGDST